MANAYRRLPFAGRLSTTDHFLLLSPLRLSRGNYARREIALTLDDREPRKMFCSRGIGENAREITNVLEIDI